MWWPYGMEHLGPYSLRQAKKSTSEEASARQIPLHSHDSKNKGQQKDLEP